MPSLPLDGDNLPAKRRSGIARFPSCTRSLVSRAERILEESMASMREWMRRLWGTIRRNPRDSEMQEELRSHLELASEDMQRRGGSTDDALRAARLKAGS